MYSLQKEYCKVCNISTKKLSEFTQVESDKYDYLDISEDINLYNLYCCLKCKTISVICNCSEYCKYIGNTGVYYLSHRLSKYIDVNKYKYVYKKQRKNKDGVYDSIMISNKIIPNLELSELFELSELSEYNTLGDFVDYPITDIFSEINVYIRDDPINTKYEVLQYPITILLDDDDLTKYPGEFDLIKNDVGLAHYRGYENIYLISFEDFDIGLGSDGGLMHYYRCMKCDEIYEITNL